MKNRRFYSCLVLVFHFLAIKAGIIDYSDKQLHLMFKLNTDTKEATLGWGGSSSTFNNAIYSPSLDEWWDNWRLNTDRVLVIPDTVSYNGEKYAVTKVADYAFAEFDYPLKIVLPEGIREIGDHAFYKCAYLKAVSLPNSLLSLGEGVFSWAVRLTDIIIPDNVTEIPVDAFNLCHQMKTVKLPANLEKICRAAFFDCYALESLSIPGSCTYIDDEAFTFCKGLKSLRLEDGPKPITMGYAYNMGIEWDPSKYTDVNGEYYLTCFVRGLFNECPLKNLYVGRDIIQSPVPAKYEISPFDWWRGRADGFKSQTSKWLETLEFGPMVTSIPDNFLPDGSVSGEFTLPPNVEYIGTNAFYRCFHKQCAILDIPATCDSIGSNAFGSWGDVEYIVCHSSEPCNVASSFINSKGSTNPSTPRVIVPNGSGYEYRNKEVWSDFKIIDRYIDPQDEVVDITLKFAGSLSGRLKQVQKTADEIKRLKLSGKMNEKDWETVQTMTNLYDFDMSGLSLDTLPSLTFLKNTLKRIRFPETMTVIKNNQFSGFYLCDTLYIPESCSSIGDNAFPNSLFDKIVISGSATVNSGTFNKNYFTTDVEIGSGSVTVASNAFSSAPLESVTIGDGATVATNAFTSNTKLKNIFLGNGVKSIQKNAFPVVLLDTLTIEGNILDCSAGAFPFTSKVLSIGSIEGWCSTGFASADDNPMNKADKILLSDGELVNLVLSDNVDQIKAFSFANCHSLKTVLLPVKPIGISRGAFAGCENLESVISEGGLNTIGDQAFEGCISLDNVLLSGNVKSIGNSAFLNCSSLTSINFPDELGIIGQSAFENCNSLTGIKFPYALENIGNSAFKNCTSLTEIEMPDSLKTIGISAFKGCNSVTQVLLSNNLTEIPDSAFYGCSALETISIPERVGRIGALAFKLDTLLSSLELSASLSRIEREAFAGCSSLQQVEFPVQLQSIGIRAFENCASLKDLYTYWMDPIVIPVNVFDGVPWYSLLHVPYNTGQLYYDAGWGQLPDVEENYYVLLIKSNSGGSTKVGNYLVREFDRAVGFDTDADFDVMFIPDRHYYVNGVYVEGDGYNPEQTYFGILDDNKITLESLSSNISLCPNFAQFVPGDVNFDSIVNIADIPALVRVIQKNPLPSYHPFTTDVNEDGNVDIGDVISIVNMIIENYKAPARMAPVRTGSEQEYVVQMEMAELNSKNGIIVELENTMPVSGVQLEFVLPKGYSIPSDLDGRYDIQACDGITAMNLVTTAALSDDTIQILAASTDGDQISRGNNRLFFIPLNVTNGLVNGNDVLQVTNCKVAAPNSVVYQCSYTQEIPVCKPTGLSDVWMSPNLAGKKILDNKVLLIEHNGKSFKLNGVEIEK